MWEKQVHPNLSKRQLRKISWACKRQENIMPCKTEYQKLGKYRKGEIGIDLSPSQFSLPMGVPCGYWATWTFVCFCVLTVLVPLKSEYAPLDKMPVMTFTFLLKANASCKPKISWRKRGENTPALVICSSYVISFLISSSPSHLNCVYSKPKEAQQNLNSEKEGD